MTDLTEQRLPRIAGGPLSAKKEKEPATVEAKAGTFLSRVL